MSDKTYFETIPRKTWPLANYSFKTRDHAARWLEETRQSLKATANYRNERKAERCKPHTLVVGDILRSSWGYDQTNVDYYQVTKTSARCVWVREIGAQRESTGWETGNCVPLPDSFKGAEKKYVTNGPESIRVASYACATKVKAREVAGVKVFEADRWSSYA